jgi:hypothetical protein
MFLPLNKDIENRSQLYEDLKRQFPGYSAYQLVALLELWNIQMGGSRTKTAWSTSNEWYPFIRPDRVSDHFNFLFGERMEWLYGQDNPTTGLFTTLWDSELKDYSLRTDYRYAILNTFTNAQIEDLYQGYVTERSIDPLKEIDWGTVATDIGAFAVFGMSWGAWNASSKFALWASRTSTAMSLLGMADAFFDMNATGFGLSSTGLVDIGPEAVLHPPSNLGWTRFAGRIITVQQWTELMRRRMTSPNADTIAGIVAETGYQAPGFLSPEEIDFFTSSGFNAIPSSDYIREQLVAFNNRLVEIEEEITAIEDERRKNHYGQWDSVIRGDRITTVPIPQPAYELYYRRIHLREEIEKIAQDREYWIQLCNLYYGGQC